MAGDDPDSLTPSPPPPTPEAPAEKRGSIWTRRKIVVAFWGVVVALALPHWIYTTSIHRSSLPVDDMLAWSQGDACTLDYPLHIHLIDEGGSAASLAQAVEQQLREDAELSPFSFHVTPQTSNASIAFDALRTAQPVDSDMEVAQESALTVNIKSDGSLKSPQASLASWLPLLDIHHSPKTAASDLAPFVVHEIKKVFIDERDELSHILANGHFRTRRPIAQLSPDTKAALDAKSTRAFKYASTYHLTFSLFTATATPSSWDIETALADTIHPLLTRFAAISRFTIDTQVQLYASFSPSTPPPVYHATSRAHLLSPAALTNFVNAAEWPLTPTLGAGPTLNFLLYVPAPHHSPLLLEDSSATSWLIPQWGAVRILNLPSHPTTLSAADLEPSLLTFATHLSTLLGLPSSPPSLSLRLSRLSRARTTSILLSASSTLGALARLTNKLQNIAIPASVSLSVNKTLARLDSACANLNSGEYAAALEDARRAEEEAEKAFFEPSMVGQVYFPDEHKVAVYVPLLGPMAVPMVMALVKEGRELIKGLRGRRGKLE